MTIILNKIYGSSHYGKQSEAENGSHHVNWYSNFPQLVEASGSPFPCLKSNKMDDANMVPFLSTNAAHF